MKNEDYVTLKVAKKLSEKGFDWPTHSMYGKIYRIRDEIKEKYPGLSDDGYYDLLEYNGGSLKEDDVYGEYIEALDCYCKNTCKYFNQYPHMICSRPSLYEAQKWFRIVKGIHVEVIYMSEDYWLYEILTIPNHDLIGLSDRKTVKYVSYEEALNEGILEALKLI